MGYSAKVGLEQTTWMNFISIVLIATMMFSVLLFENLCLCLHCICCSDLFHLYSFGASADRCIHNIYRKLRQEAGTSKKYPGVLASLLMLDKMSIEDIKASITELMAGGVDTVRKKKKNHKKNKTLFFGLRLFCLSAYFCLRVSDFCHTAVDIV